MTDNPFRVSEYETQVLRLRLVAPAPGLRRYVSGYYRTEVKPGRTAEDWLPPEEGNLRVGQAKEYVAGFDGELACVPRAIVSGPSTRATHLRIREGKFWGFGLTPAGWARIVRSPASRVANRFVDIVNADVPAPLGALLGRLARQGDDIARCAEDIDSTLLSLLGQEKDCEETIVAVHRALVSHDCKTVAEHAAMANMTLRTFERFCLRHFGFTPGALLRRQRFLRSLAQWAAGPAMRWIDSLDPDYFDQPHFVREFRAIMGMTPSRYAELPHPITQAAVAVITANADVALQALYHPDRQESRNSGV